jgi:hypothetical protein
LHKQEERAALPPGRLEAEPALAEIQPHRAGLLSECGDEGSRVRAERRREGGGETRTRAMSTRAPQQRPPGRICRQDFPVEGDGQHPDVVQAGKEGVQEMCRSLLAGTKVPARPRR